MPLITNTTKKKKLSDLEETFKKIRESAGTLFRGVATEGVTGRGGEMLIKPGIIPKLGAGVGVGAGEGEGEGVTGDTAYDKLVAKLTTALTKFGEAPTLREEREELEEEKGVETKREIVGSFEEEISKTQTLLDELEEDITKRTREFLVSEPQRRRIEAAERAPITKEFGRLTRGLGVAEAGLARAETDILTELGLIEKERILPLELLQREVSIRSQIKDLVDKDIPNVVSSTFDDEGDLTLVMQDPETGALTTQTVSGIGKKAAQYQSFQSSVDDKGNLTIIGITKDGKATTIGTFKGVGRVTKEKEEVTDVDYADITKALYDVGLPTTVSTMKGELTKGSQDKLVAAGIPLDTALGIWQAIIGGESLDDIRQYLASQIGQDEGFKLLDTFMQALQKKGGTEGLPGYEDIPG